MRANQCRLGEKFAGDHFDKPSIEADEHLVEANKPSSDLDSRIADPVSAIRELVRQMRASRN